MAQNASPAGADTPDQRIVDPAVLDDLRAGGRLIRRAFLASELCHAGRDAVLVRVGEPNPRVLAIRSGFAVRSCTLPDRRRAILDVLVPGDICGLDHVFTRRPAEELVAAGQLAHYALTPSVFRALLSQPQAALRIMALVVQANQRLERVAAMIGRFDAHARLCTLLLDIHDRLRRRDLISAPTYTLPLTQEQIADHLGLTLVHVNRTLRRLRGEGLLMIDRQVVTITDPGRVRMLTHGLPHPPEMPEPILLVQKPDSR